MWPKRTPLVRRGSLASEFDVDWVVEKAEPSNRCVKGEYLQSSDDRESEFKCQPRLPVFDQKFLSDIQNSVYMHMSLMSYFCI